MSEHKKVSQANKVLRFMMKHGSITTMQAFTMGITRLSARVYELRRRGIDITSEPGTAKNRDGETVHFAVYKLAA